MDPDILEGVHLKESNAATFGWKFSTGDLRFTQLCKRRLEVFGSGRSGVVGSWVGMFPDHGGLNRYGFYSVCLGHRSTSFTRVFFICLTRQVS